MKNPFITASVLSLMGSIIAVSAYADNSNVEDALKKRADLSTFYQALVNTGVNHELNSDTTYTIFAPTNNAFTRIHQDQYPCFYTVECRLQVAQIIRNHIIPDKVFIDDAVKQRGGFYSIGGRFVNVGEPNRDDYTMDGNNILNMSRFGGGVLYKIDGVIANPREMASVQSMEYASAQPQRVTTTTTKIIPDPACGPGGCPDAVSQTTTITRSVITSPVR